MTVLLGLTEDLAEGFCDGVVAIVVDVVDGLGTTTWIAPVVGCVAGFVSSDLCGGSVAGLQGMWELLAIGRGISRNRWVVMVM